MVHFLGGVKINEVEQKRNNSEMSVWFSSVVCLLVRVRDFQFSSVEVFVRL